jgi:hypothetical protein
MARVQDRNHMRTILIHESQHLLQVKSGEHTAMVRDHLTKPYDERFQEIEATEAQERRNLPKAGRAMNPPIAAAITDDEADQKEAQMMRWTPPVTFDKDGKTVAVKGKWLTRTRKEK